jgi:O-methyltransferase
MKLIFSKILNPDRTPQDKFLTLVKIVQEKIKKSKRLRIMFKPKAPLFAGWGMTSMHALPWDLENSTDLTGLQFLKVDLDFLNKINLGEVYLGFGNDKEVNFSNLLNEHRWRHYIVYWSAKLAARNTKSQGPCNFVESGVWYGMSATYAISALENQMDKDSNYKIYLYDAWDSMKLEHLTTKESWAEGEYSYLSLDQTKTNLKEFKEHCEFIKGYIPEVFSESPGPNKLSWLHIDLNSSMPTQKTLEQFVPKLLSGGIVLFDDYGHKGWSETKKVADEFFTEKDGTLMPLPTGQAIFFKR